VVEEVKRLPEEPATERQLSYARDLGLRFPQAITKKEMSDLLDCHLSHDRPASQRHRGFAEWLGVETTRYVGKRALFDQIAASLKKPGREEDLAAWFVYRVCRHLVRGGKDHPRATGPDSVVVREIAAELVADTSTMRSIRRYEGRELIWFGQWTAPDGSVHEGGSIRTAAFKCAVSLVGERLGLRRAASTSSVQPVADLGQQRRPTRPSKPKTGCLSGLIGLVFAIGIVTALLLAIF